MLVIDTNILACLLIERDRTGKVQDLYRADADWHSEEFILVEFSNVLATYARTGDLTATRARGLLDEAIKRLSGGLIAVPHAEALAAANSYQVSAYDARFLAAAESRGVKLVTEDETLRKAAPPLTQSVDDVLATIK